jgi:hypothetical protein
LFSRNTVTYNTIGLLLQKLVIQLINKFNLKQLLYDIVVFNVVFMFVFFKILASEAIKKKIKGWAPPSNV